MESHKGHMSFGIVELNVDYLEGMVGAVCIDRCVGYIDTRFWWKIDVGMKGGDCLKTASIGQICV